MSKSPVKSEPFDALQIRRRAARKVLGWINAETNNVSDEHAEVCRMLADSGFMPEAEFTSAAGVLCGTGAAAVKLSSEMSQTLAKAELDHFASRYFFYEPKQRSELWTQLTDTVAPYPALAWRHLHLKAGLNLSRGLEEHGDLAASVLQWFLQSPHDAARSLQNHVLNFAATDDSVTMLEDGLAGLLESAPDYVMLIPAAVADIQSRWMWLSSSNIYVDAMHESIVSAPISEIEREMLDRYNVLDGERSGLLINPQAAARPKSFAELDRFQKSCFVLVMFFLLVLLLAEIGRLTWIYMERSEHSESSVERDSQFTISITDACTVRSRPFFDFTQDCEFEYCGTEGNAPQNANLTLVT